MPRAAKRKQRAGTTGRYPASRGSHRHGMPACTGKRVADDAPDWAADVPEVPDVPRRAHRRFPRF